MFRLPLFVVCLFLVPWLLGFVLPSPAPTVRSFLATFIPVVWTPTFLTIVFLVGAFFNPSLPHYHISMVAMLPFIALFGVFLGTIFFRAGNSVLATMAAHLTFNILIAIGGAVITSSILWATLSLVFALIAVPFSLSLRRVAMALTSVATASPT